jgi:hypothetical protein
MKNKNIGDGTEKVKKLTKKENKALNLYFNRTEEGTCCSCRVAAQ